MITKQSSPPKTQFITDDHGEKVAVILPLKDYEKLMEELDELECIKAYDKAKQGRQEFLEADDVFNAIEQERKQA